MCCGDCGVVIVIGGCHGGGGDEKGRAETHCPDLSSGYWWTQLSDSESLSPIGTQAGRNSIVLYSDWYLL